MSELVLHRLSGDAGFEFGTQAPSFSFTHLVLFRVGRPQKLALFINKALVPFPGATSVSVTTQNFVPEAEILVGKIS